MYRCRVETTQEIIYCLFYCVAARRSITVANRARLDWFDYEQYKM